MKQKGHKTLRIGVVATLIAMLALPLFQPATPVATAHPAAPTYVANAENSTTSGTSVLINKPTGTTTDDVMVAVLQSTIGSDSNGSTMSGVPSGWSEQENHIISASSGVHVYIYIKVAGASEPASYTWTWTNSCGWVGQIVTFKGVDTGTPVNVESTVNLETSTSPMSPSMTTTVVDCMVFAQDSSDDDDVPATGGAPGGTTWIDQTEIIEPGNGTGLSTAYYVQASAGATGNKDWSLSASEENGGYQLALQPPQNLLPGHPHPGGNPCLCQHEDRRHHAGPGQLLHHRP